MTQEQIIEVAERVLYGTENIGICTVCGEENHGVEPDAEGYECECCGENAVNGIEYLLLGC